jgi:hypothetical protein
LPGWCSSSSWCGAAACARTTRCWLATGIALLLLTLFRPLMDELARLMGIITYPPAALFVVALVFMLAILLQYSLALTRLSRENKKIAQEMALLRQQVDALRQASAQGQQPPGDERQGQHADVS